MGDDLGIRVDHCQHKGRGGLEVGGQRKGMCWGRGGGGGPSGAGKGRGTDLLEPQEEPDLPTPHGSPGETSDLQNCSRYICGVRSC